MTRLIINGCKGRMGGALLECAALQPELQVTGQVDLGDDLEKVLPNADVVVEFSFHNVTPGVAALCAKHKKALVIGTTGHSPEEKTRIASFSAEIPMVWASNYSTGVNALFCLTQQAAQIRGPDFGLEVVEMHHRTQK